MTLHKYYFWFCLFHLTLLADPPRLPVYEGQAGEKAFADLGAYYNDSDARPPYQTALDQLGSENTGEAEKAGLYLLALFQQSFADESNGRSQWESTPFWAGGSMNSSRRFRECLAADFAKKAKGETALPAVEWLLFSEKLFSGQVAGMEALKNIPGPAAEVVITRVLEQSHSNAAVLEIAVVEAGGRELKELTPQLTALCMDYRGPIRNAAREACTSFGVDPLPVYRPADAFTPSLDAKLKSIQGMLLSEVQAHTAFMQFTITHPPRVEGEKETTNTYPAWVLSETGEAWMLLSLFGEEHVLGKENVQAEELSLKTVAKEMRELREQQEAKGENGAAFSRMGMLSHQFEPDSISLPEALVGMWCYTRGEKVAAAEILLPRLKEMKDESYLVLMVRDYLGHGYHQEMLRAFSHHRDLEKTLQLAEHISKPVFEGYEYQERAKELAAQLPRRMNDFKSFVLPSAADWTELQKQLKRTEQIKYLADRLRLLNCIQWGQPGGVSYDDPQFAEPVAPFEEEQKNPVINPYVELSGMELRVDDLPGLIPYLEDESYMPTFSYWRNFHPSRTLHRVNWGVAGLVNKVAKRDLADLKAWIQADESGKEKHMQGIAAWVEANRGKDPETLLLDTLKTSEDWSEISAAAEELVVGRHMAALPLLVGLTAQMPDHKEDLINYVYHLDAPESAVPARQWVGSADAASRFYAGLILLKHGDHSQQEGLKIIAESIKALDDIEFHAMAVEPLLENGRPDAEDLALKIMENEEFDISDSNCDAVAKRFFLGGKREVLDYLTEGLDDRSEHGNISNGKETVMLTRGDDIAEELGSWRKDWRYDEFAGSEIRDAMREDLKAWLKSQFEKVTSGDVPDMDTEITGIRRTYWHVDAP